MTLSRGVFVIYVATVTTSANIHTATNGDTTYTTTAITGDRVEHLLTIHLTSPIDVPRYLCFYLKPVSESCLKLKMHL